MTWGKGEMDARIAAAAREEGDPIPETVTDRPTVEPHDELYWQCFMDLCGTRPVGHGLGAIPWTAVDQWANRYGVADLDEFEALQRVVQKLDLAWLDLQRQNLQKG